MELRQVGLRDEARLQGGIGPCGRDLCCATFLKDLESAAVAGDIKAAMLSALREMPLPQRLVLILHYHEGVALKDVPAKMAALLGMAMSAGAAWIRELDRAVQRLHDEGVTKVHRAMLAVAL